MLTAPSSDCSAVVSLCTNVLKRVGGGRPALILTRDSSKGDRYARNSNYDAFGDEGIGPSRRWSASSCDCVAFQVLRRRRLASTEALPLWS